MLVDGEQSLFLRVRKAANTANRIVVDIAVVARPDEDRTEQPKRPRQSTLATLHDRASPRSEFLVSRGLP